MSKEILRKDIPGYEGSYQATSDGRIYSLLTNKFLVGGKKSKRKHGKRTLLPYHYVNLRINGRPQRRYVHRLIMLAFEGEMPKDCQCVMHINDDPEDNRLLNLKYGSHSDNIKESFKKGRSKPNEFFLGKKGRLHWKSIPISAFNGDNPIGQYESMRIAEKETGIDICSISNSIKYNRPVFGVTFKRAG